MGGRPVAPCSLVRKALHRSRSHGTPSQTPNAASTVSPGCGERLIGWSGTKRGYRPSNVGGVVHHHCHAVDSRFGGSSVLRWARESCGLTEVAAARKLGLPDDRVAAWEVGEVVPTIAQLRKAAEVYKRSLAVFFLSEPPEGLTPYATSDDWTVPRRVNGRRGFTRSSVAHTRNATSR